MENAIYNARTIINNFNKDYEYNNIVDRMILNIFNGNPALEKAISECNEKGIDPALITEAHTVMMKAIKKKAKLSLPHELKTKFDFLKAKYPDIAKDELIKCTLRYAALGFGGQQWALGHDMMDKVKLLGINMEAFASPFNNYFATYCSLFAEDEPFGSVGDFFAAELPDKLYVNPPFVPAILANVPDKIKNIKKLVMITPSWRDAPWYIELSKTCVAHKKINETYRALGREFTPKFTTTVWTRGLNESEIASLT